MDARGCKMTHSEIPEYPGDDDLEFWLSRLKEPNFVYVIQGRPNTPIKIGVAKNPHARLAQLQTGNPFPLHLLYVVPGDRWLEAELHERANVTFRSLGGTEWFHYCEELEPLLLLIHALGEAMKADYDGSGDPPPYPGEIGEAIYFGDYAPWATPKTGPIASKAIRYKPLGHRRRVSPW